MNPRQRILLDAVMIAALGATIGLAVNHRLVSDAFTGRMVAPAPVTAPAVSRLPQPVLLAGVRELASSGAVLVDARDGVPYAEGHLPAALSLPLGEVDARLGTFRQQVAAEKTLVVYCNGYGCPDSFDLGVRLLKEGYRDVRVFEGGFPEWRDAGLPVEKGGR
jgi:rhodanese-related sulfurtransferase